MRALQAGERPVKSLVSYWVAGSIFLGLAVGQRVTRCPNDKIDLGVSDIAFVAVWPAVLVAATIIIMKGVSFSTPECKQ